MPRSLWHRRIQKVKPIGQYTCTQQRQFGGGIDLRCIQGFAVAVSASTTRGGKREREAVCSFGLEQVLNPNDQSKIMQENTARKYLGEREPAGHDEPNRSKLCGCSASARHSITDLKSLVRMEYLFILALGSGPAAGSARGLDRMERNRAQRTRRGRGSLPRNPSSRSTPPTQISMDNWTG
jgi:hypothetical protein